MEIAGPGLMSGGRIIKKTGFFLFLSLALVGVSSCHPYIDDGGSFFGKDDCIAHYQYIAYIPNNVDSVKIKLFDRTKALEQEEYSMLGYYKDFQFFGGRLVTKTRLIRYSSNYIFFVMLYGLSLVIINSLIVEMFLPTLTIKSNLRVN